MKKNQLSILSKILLLCSGVALIISVFVPLWRIDLVAPQYPEGLKLLIYPDTISGNVDIINGLNHYIGMKTIHTKDFIEFSILPYLIGFFALLCFLTALLNRRKWLLLLLILFILFGIIAIADFWRWEYNYGHNLDQNAAIIVPGMSYQPPLIGFKQLLNFGAYSFPDTGGWLFFGVGIAILLAYIKESFFRKTNLHPVICISFLVFGFTGCSVRNPEPVKLNTDNCTYCKMTIAEEKFAAELITNKGKLFKFDDLYCMLQYKKLNVSTEKNRYFVANYSKPKQFLDATTAVYIQNNQLKSPMLGNMMAFPDLTAAQKNDPSGTIVLQNWEQIQLK